MYDNWELVYVYDILDLYEFALHGILFSMFMSFLAEQNNKNKEGIH